MHLPLLEWFRDEDGWTMPEGRRGEFVSVVVVIPVFVFFVTLERGVPSPLDYPFAVLLGTGCGFCYAVYWRDRLLSLVPEGIRSFTVSVFLTGGLGLTLLEIVHLAAPTVVFVLAACGTVLAVYGVRLCSPVHDGIRPPRRGVEPPPSLESEPPDR